MKKIMIMLAAAACAVGVQAASFQWKSNTQQYIYQAGTTTKASGTIYLFDSAVLSQAALLDAILYDGTAISSLTSLDNTTLASNGSFTKTSNFASIATDQTLDAYVAMVIGDDVFVSAIKSGAGQASLTTPLAFGGLNAASKAESVEWTEDGSFSAAGWYKAASSSGDDPAIPEPTSGLLMLVGLGALALRRRR